MGRKNSKKSDWPLSTESKYLQPLAKSVGLTAHCDHVDMDQGSHIQIRSEGKVVYESFRFKKVATWLRKRRDRLLWDLIKIK